MTGKQSLKKLAGSLLAIGLLSATLVAETSPASRYDNQIQNTVISTSASSMPESSPGRRVMLRACAT
jgi:hypothetical protein